MTAASPRHLAALALALAACTPVERPAAPLDRYTFPTGIALHEGRLLVVSSNFDLTFEDEKGGSVLSTDPDGWLATPPTRTFDGVRIPSFGGEIAVAAAPACGLATPEALVASRLSGRLYRLAIGADGALSSCGADCRVEVADPGVADPFAVEVLCRPGQPPRALVGWLRTLSGAECGEDLATTTSCAILSEVRLDGSTPSVRNAPVVFNEGGIRQLHYDAGTDLLFFVTTGSALGWVDLSTDCEIGSAVQPCPAQSIDLGGAIRGLEVRSLALSSGLPRRLFVAGRLYDPDAAASGIRLDVGGVLVVLDLESSATGGHDARLVRTVSLATGISQVIRLPARPGRGDLVAVTATDDGEVWFYDDGLDAVTGVLGRDRSGVPVVGEAPYGLAAEDLGAALRLYVGSFGDAVVSVVEVTPDDPGGSTVVGRIGE